MDKELAELEKDLASIKAKINQTIGQRDSILKRMQTDFGVSSLEEARVRIGELEAAEAESRVKWEALKAEYVELCK